MQFRGDALRRLGRFVRAMWRRGLRDAVVFVGLEGALIGSFLAGVYIPGLRPLLWLSGAVIVGVLALAFFLVAGGAYLWFRKLWQESAR